MSLISQYFYNDAGMIPVYIIVLMIAFLIMAASIFFHEIGHLLYFKFKLKNKNARIRFVFNSITDWYWAAGDKEDYAGINNTQYSGLMVSGVTFGVLPILFSAYIWFPFILLLVPYVTGSWSDIKEFGKTIDKNE